MLDVFFVCEDAEVVEVLKKEFVFYPNLNIGFKNSPDDISSYILEEKPYIAIGLFGKDEDKEKFKYDDFDFIYEVKKENGVLTGHTYMYSVDLISYCHKIMNRYSEFCKVLDSIEKKDVRLYFKEYSFNGGGCHEDEHVFELIENRKAVGEITLLDFDEDVRFRLNDEGNNWLFDPDSRSNKSLMKMTIDCIGKALIRDDREYCSIMNDGTSVFMPQCYGYITREDVNKNLLECSIPFAKL